MTIHKFPHIIQTLSGINPVSDTSKRIDFVIRFTPTPRTNRNIRISFIPSRIYLHIRFKIPTNLPSPLGHIREDSTMLHYVIYLSGKYPHGYRTTRKRLHGSTLSCTRSNRSKHIRPMQCQRERKYGTTRLSRGINPVGIHPRLIVLGKIFHHGIHERKTLRVTIPGPVHRTTGIGLIANLYRSRRITDILLDRLLT